MYRTLADPYEVIQTTVWLFALGGFIGFYIFSPPKVKQQGHSKITLILFKCKTAQAK